MNDLWCPFAERNDAPANLWGDYRDDDGKWKYVLHTTEAKTFKPSPSKYYGGTSYPHATILSDKIYQHVPINRAARALRHPSGTPETNADLAVQVEIAWKAAEAEQMTVSMLDNVKKFGLWMAKETGMPWQCSVSFVGPESSPAGVNAKQRMSLNVWDNYSGICGHQHVPNNDHWDPGKINIAYLLKTSNPLPEPEPWMKHSHWMMTPDGNGIIVFDGYQGKPLATMDEFYLLVGNKWIEPHNPANDQERMQQPIYDFLTRK